MKRSGSFVLLYLLWHVVAMGQAGPAPAASGNAMNLKGPIDLQTALVLAVAALGIAAAFGAWIYAQFIKPSIDGQATETRALSAKIAEAEKSIAVWNANEKFRKKQLINALKQLRGIIEILREEIKTGDLGSRIGSGEALVRSLRVAANLAKLESEEKRHQLEHDLEDAESALKLLRDQWDRDSKQKQPYIDLNLDGDLPELQ